MNSMVLLPLLAAIAAFSIFVALRTRQRQARLLEIEEANRVRQEFVMARLDEISKLIADTTRSNAELQAAFDPLLAELTAADTDGTLAPLIADTEKFFTEHLAKRQTLGAS